MFLRGLIHCLFKCFGIRYWLNCWRKCDFANTKLCIVILSIVSFCFYYLIKNLKTDISVRYYSIKVWICILLMAFLFHFCLNEFFLLLKKFKVFCKLKERRCNNPVLSFTSVIIVLIIVYAISFEKEKNQIYEAVLLFSVISIISACLILSEDYSDAEINSCQNPNESIGAFWAHHAYNAYYKIVLSDIKDRMSSFEEKHNLKLQYKKLVLVIPLSCNVSKTLSEKDDSLIYFEKLPIIENDQGANINREYKNPVYKIETSDKDVYIASEYPSSLRTLWKTKDRMDNAYWIYHRDCFIRTLKYLVIHSPCVVVEYDDTVESPKALHKVLLSTLSGKDDTIIDMEQ